MAEHYDARGRTLAYVQDREMNMSIFLEIKGVRLTHGGMPLLEIAYLCMLLYALLKKLDALPAAACMLDGEQQQLRLQSICIGISAFLQA